MSKNEVIQFRTVPGEGLQAFYDGCWHWSQRLPSEIDAMVAKGVAVVLENEQHADDDPRPWDLLETMGETLDDEIPDDLIGYLV